MYDLQIFSLIMLVVLFTLLIVPLKHKILNLNLPIFKFCCFVLLPMFLTLLVLDTYLQLFV
jgi:hypothetical protein